MGTGTKGHRRLKIAQIGMVMKWAEMAEIGRPGCFKCNKNSWETASH